MVPVLAESGVARSCSISKGVLFGEISVPGRAVMLDFRPRGVNVSGEFGDIGDAWCSW